MNKIHEFEKKLEEQLEDSKRYSFITRSADVLNAAMNDTYDLYEEANKLKDEMIKNKNEDLANKLLAYELILAALHNEIHMLLELKNGNPKSAWSCLIEAQDATIGAIHSHSCMIQNSNYLRKLELYEQLLFPPQTFLSVGFVSTKAVCTICGEDYSKCSHIKGRPYMGKLCFRRLLDIKGIEECSLVPNPANKRNTIDTITDEGVERDYLTLDEIGKSEESRTFLGRMVTIGVTRSFDLI